MYNRYIPQPDGSYQRSRMQDSSRPAPPPRSKPPEAPPHSPPTRPQSVSAGSFLKRLLPLDLETEDLLVILLLLLIAGDCEQERSNALLTLALYLFL